MFLRILLGVACLSLLTASEAEAQLFRRRFAPRQAQQQQYAPRAAYSQNGYQGRLTATPRTRQMYIRRSDGSVVPYYPANTPQATANRNRQTLAQIANRQQQVDAARLAQQQQAAAQLQSRLATTEGQLEAVVPPTPQLQRRLSSVYQSPPVEPAAPQASVAPVGVSVVNASGNQTSLDSISPAVSMPQASTIDPASSIPVSTAATNPAPGLTLSAPGEVVSASATVPVETPSSDLETGQETFSVLEKME